MVIEHLRTLLVAVLVLAGMSGPAAAGGETGVDAAGLAVAQSYFDALQSGDRGVLLALFGERERSRTEVQLSDPAYSQFLRDRYSTATLEVIDGGVISGVSYVDIAIWLNDSEAVRERLILKNSNDSADAALKIFAREVLF